MREFETKFVGRLMFGSAFVVATAANMLERFETGKILVQTTTELIEDIISSIEHKYPSGIKGVEINQYWPRFLYCSTVIILYSIEKTYPHMGDEEELKAKLSDILEDLKPVWTHPDHKLSFTEKRVLSILQQEGLLTDNPEI